MDIYDEVIEVKGAREIDSPPDLDVSSAIRFVGSAHGHFSDSEEHSLDILDKRASVMANKRPQSSMKKKYPAITKLETSESESDSSEQDDDQKPASFTDGVFNPKDFDYLDVPPDVKELFQYIPRYTPQKIEIKYKLQPFIPNFIPSVGDIDAFLKVIPPQPLSDGQSMTEFMDQLGLEILDEPGGQQSEPALLHMKLRSITTGPQAPGPPPAVVKSTKDIDKWITELQSIHANRPLPSITHNKQIPDIDTLMAEWPPDMERALDTIGFPRASLDCQFSAYVALTCALLDIPIPVPEERTQADYIVALHTLFTLFSAVKNAAGTT